MACYGQHSDSIPVDNAWFQIKVSVITQTTCTNPGPLLQRLKDSKLIISPRSQMEIAKVREAVS